MSASLQQLLREQPPTTSGIHEAMARHSEAIFDQFQGILPLFLGKRRTGSFITLNLPNAVTSSSESLLQTLTDFVWVYDLRLISFVSAMRIQLPSQEQAKLSAVLITADTAHAHFQLPWEMQFDAQDDLVSAKRGTLNFDIIPREVWSQLFATKPSVENRRFSLDRLEERFGALENLPRP